LIAINALSGAAHAEFAIPAPLLPSPRWMRISAPDAGKCLANPALTLARTCSDDRGTPPSLSPSL
jgi:hypothetical protein